MACIEYHELVAHDALNEEEANNDRVAHKDWLVKMDCNDAEAIIELVAFNA